MQWCAGNCTTGSLEVRLICGICQFLTCKYSHHGRFKLPTELTHKFPENVTMGSGERHCVLRYHHRDNMRYCSWPRLAQYAECSLILWFPKISNVYSIEDTIASHLKNKVFYSWQKKKKSSILFWKPKSEIDLCPSKLV